MELVGVWYPNLARRTDRNFYMRCMLTAQDVPIERILRLNAIDHLDYDTRDAVCDAAVADGFPFFDQHRVRNGQFTKPDLACQWTWCTGLRELFVLLDPGECVLYMLDDMLIRKLWHDYAAVVERLNDLCIWQIFMWKPNEAELKRSGGLVGSCTRYDACNFVVEPKTGVLYNGFNYAGDSILVISKEGARMALDWVSHFCTEFLETIIYRMGQSVVPGCYSSVKPWEWFGYPRLAGSDRVDISTNESLPSDMYAFHDSGR